jgi:hypothetical protein
MVLEWGPLSLVSTTEELLGRNSSGCGLESWDYSRGDALPWPCDTLYRQKLELSSPTSSCHLVSTVRLRTRATEFYIYICIYIYIYYIYFYIYIYFIYIYIFIICLFEAPFRNSVLPVFADKQRCWCGSTGVYIHVAFCCVAGPLPGPRPTHYADLDRDGHLVRGSFRGYHRGRGRIMHGKAISAERVMCFMDGGEVTRNPRHP